MIRLTNRLQAVVKQIKKGATVADIGTDHGYIPVYLMQNNIASKIIATDINAGPLEIARGTIAEHGLEDRIEIRQGNGFDIIGAHEVDTVIIAGMGGVLIRDIILGHIEKARSIKYFILQPMGTQKELRKWLLTNNFKIVHEELTMEDRRIYEIIVVQNGYQKVYSEMEFEISPKWVEKRDPLLEAVVLKKIKKQEEIILHLSKQTTKKAIHRLEECKKKHYELEGVLRCLKK